MANIGRNIQALREDADLTANDMAEYLSIAPREMRSIERGDVLPTVTQVERIGDLFAMSMQDVIDGKSQTCGLSPCQMRDVAGEVDMRMLSEINRIAKNISEMQALLERERRRSPGQSQCLGAR